MCGVYYFVFELLRSILTLLNFLAISRLDGSTRSWVPRGSMKDFPKEDWEGMYRGSSCWEVGHFS